MTYIMCLFALACGEGNLKKCSDHAMTVAHFLVNHHRALT